MFGGVYDTKSSCGSVSPWCTFLEIDSLFFSEILHEVIEACMLKIGRALFGGKISFVQERGKMTQKYT